VSRVAIDRPAPDFTLMSFDGRPVALRDYRGRRHVVLVFNRGFT
jgi:peroxiredoxin